MTGRPHSHRSLVLSQRLERLELSLQSVIEVVVVFVVGLFLRVSLPDLAHAAEAAIGQNFVQRVGRGRDPEGLGRQGAPVVRRHYVLGVVEGCLAWDRQELYRILTVSIETLWLVF